MQLRKPVYHSRFGVSKAARRPAYFSIGAVILILFLLGYVFFHKRPLASPVTTQTSSTPAISLAGAFTYLKTVPTSTALNTNFLTQVNICLIPAAGAYGYNLYIAAGLRTSTDQNILYAQGRTVNGHIVTNAMGGQSMHNFGYAVDLADHANGENINYGELGNIAAWCGLEHGDRGYTDLPHFEYRGGLSIEEFQAGMRPVPLTIPCKLLTTRAANNQSVTKADLTSCGAPNFAVEAQQPTFPANSSQD